MHQGVNFMNCGACKNKVLVVEWGGASQTKDGCAGEEMSSKWVGVMERFLCTIPPLPPSFSGLKFTQMEL